MSTRVQNYLAEEMVWRPSTDPRFPFIADLDGEACLIRINDFPDEHLYTLVVNGDEVASFDDWPAHWRRTGE